jgi:hypothetical protein
MDTQQNGSEPSGVNDAGATFGLDARPVRNTPNASKRDPRIDVLRGLALIMIFVDHIPGNLLSLITLRNFGFSDAAEVFVLLAGFSSMLAYGRIFQRDGARTGLRRIVLRVGRLYLFQIGLLVTTFAVALAWNTYFQLQPTVLRAIHEAPAAGWAHALTLHAVPAYLDILPLYIVLLAAFPLVYVGLRTKPWLALCVSAALWLAANLVEDFNLPNWMDGQKWFFDPFAWQFLFAIGAALAMLGTRCEGAMPRVKWLTWLCAGYLVFAFVEAAPWAAWHLPNLQPLAMSPPDKTHLGILRLLDMLALAYLVFSSAQVRAFADGRWLRPLEACGRHSLEVFAAGCVVALFGRLLFRTADPTLVMQIVINTVGLATMCVVAWWLERHRPAGQIPLAASAGAGSFAYAGTSQPCGLR